MSQPSFEGRFLILQTCNTQHGTRSWTENASQRRNRKYFSKRGQNNVSSGDKKISWNTYNRFQVPRKCEFSTQTSVQWKFQEKCSLIFPLKAKNNVLKVFKTTKTMHTPQSHPIHPFFRLATWVQSRRKRTSTASHLLLFSPHSSSCSFSFPTWQGRHRESREKLLSYFYEEKLQLRSFFLFYVRRIKINADGLK